ncbi:hypothetical protein AB0B50_16280 [Streptomyces sp. NPDC041068]
MAAENPKIPAEDLAAYVKRIVEQAPPLSDEQRDKLAALLAAPRGGVRHA